MANNLNNSVTNIELIDKINIAKGTYASRRLALPSFDLIIAAYSKDCLMGLHRTITFRRCIPMGDVKNIVRSFFKRGSYSGYPITSVSVRIGLNNEITISNPDINDTDLESIALTT